MPAAIPFAVGAAVSSAIGGGILGAVVGGLAAGLVGSAIAPKPKAPDSSSFDQTAQGALVNTSSPVDPLHVIYGLRRFGGTRVFTTVSGSANEHLLLVYAMCEGEISGIQEVYVDHDHRLNVRGGTNIGNGRYSPYAYIEKYTGTDTQAASDQLIAHSGGVWNSGDQGKGVAYIHMRLGWNADTYPQGMPTILADVRGKLVYDPRDGTTKFSNNPALAVYDYMTNSRYGRGIPASRINVQSFKDAADHCDERVSVGSWSAPCMANASTDEMEIPGPTVFGIGDGVRFTAAGAPAGFSPLTTYYWIPTAAYVPGSGFEMGKLASTHANALAGVAMDVGSSGPVTLEHVDQARYTCDGLVNPDSGWLDNLKSLLTSCRGYLVFVAGQYKLKIDKAETVQAEGFDEDSIVGSWEIRNAGKRDKVNRVRARFFNPARSWEPDIVIWDDASVRSSEDNGLVLEREIELNYTANFARALRVAQLEQRVSRFGIRASFRATGKATKFEVGDVVPITHSSPGWTAKPFRITSMQPLPNGEWHVGVIEYQAASYTLADLDTTPAIPATDLPSLLDVNAPGSLQLTSGTSDLFVAGDGTVHSRIRARWDQAGDAFVVSGGRVEIQFKESAGSPSEWEPSLFFDGGVTNAYLSPVNDGSTYAVRVRFINASGVASSWTEGPHTVVGKTELPSNVTGLSAVQQGSVVLFDVDRVTDADLDTVEIRYVEEGGSWDNASPLVNFLRGETDTTAALQPGTWDVLAKAKDTSGNYSATEARVTIEVTSTGFTLIETQEESPRWLGDRQNMIRHWTGVLTPDSRSLASELGWEVFDQFVPNAFTECWYQAPEIDKGIDAPARIWADIVSVLGPGETTGVANPRFQVDTRKSTTSYDGFENHTVGSADFRYVKGRVYVDTTLGKPVISGFEINIDNEARSEEFLSQAIGASGTTISWTTPFHSTPVVQVTPIGSTALIPTVESPSATQATIHLYNTSGAGTAGTANVTATGP